LGILLGVRENSEDHLARFAMKRLSDFVALRLGVFALKSTPSGASVQNPVSEQFQFGFISALFERISMPKIAANIS